MHVGAGPGVITLHVPAQSPADSPAHGLDDGMNRYSPTLAQRFRLTSIVVLALGMLGVGWWVSRQIETGVTQGTAETTALYMQSFVAPRVQELADGPALTDEHVAALRSLLVDTPLGTQIVAFKIWGADGRLVYSAEPAAVGRVFPISRTQARAWRGGIAAGVTDLTQEENVAERGQFRRLLETYAPIRQPDTGRIIAVAEFYQTVGHLQDEIAGAKVRSWLVVAGVAAAMYLLLAGFVQRASDTIARQEVVLREQVAHLTALLGQNAALHERVRGAAARAVALNERFLRRISAELHDGPAQDLALALLRLDQVAADPGDAGGCGAGSIEASGPQAPDAGHGAPQTGQGDGGDRIDGTAASRRAPPALAYDGGAEVTVVLDALRRALQEVRAIASGLTLPQLNDLSIGETAARAVRAHERRTATSVALEVEGVPDQAPPAVKIALYRLIQEALNNAVRHAGGAGQRVGVRYAAGALQVEVQDRGPGFDATAPAADERHLGLLGMRERAESLAGTFHIDSAPGRGTTVRAVLPMAMAPDTLHTPPAAQTARDGRPVVPVQEAAHDRPDPDRRGRRPSALPERSDSNAADPAGL